MVTPAATLSGTRPAQRLAAGDGDIHVVENDGRSVVIRAAAASPLRLLTPRNHGAGAWIYSSTYGGGLVDGDAIRVSVAIGEGATAMLSTQASTKVYRGRIGSSHETAATVSDAGLLALLPDPTVCFASARYRQKQTIGLEGSASLVLLDWIIGGRCARGERWDFEHCSTRLEVRREGRLVLLDGLCLDGKSGHLAGRMGRFNVLCTIVLAGPKVASGASEVLSEVASMAVGKRSPLLVGASPLEAGGCVIRLAGVSLEEVSSTARRYLRFVADLLGDDPWARKW